MGALDGLKISNTWALEHMLGWRGVHIEASPPSYKDLVTNRPDQINVHVAVCDKPRVGSQTPSPFPQAKFVALDRRRRCGIVRWRAPSCWRARQLCVCGGEGGGR